MEEYPVREGINFICRYVRRDALCKACGKNESWARQRLSRYRNNAKGCYYFSVQDCDIINSALPEIARQLENVSIPKVHNQENAEDARWEIEQMLKIIRANHVQKELGYKPNYWHFRISETDTRYWFTEDELKEMRNIIKMVCTILRGVHVEYEPIEE